MTYFDTTNVGMEQKRHYTKKNNSQDVAVLDFFGIDGSKEYSPSQVQSMVFSDSVPLTSVRRSITNLTNDGQLVKLDKTKRGKYGRPEHLWRLAAN